MTSVANQTKGLPNSSQPLVPRVDPNAITQSDRVKLFFSPTTKTAFAEKGAFPTSSSFSDIHMAYKVVPRGNYEHAPFWTRDMTRYSRFSHTIYITTPRYRQAFITLPLEGATVNRELAKTFHPDDSSSTISQSSHLKSTQLSRYQEEHGSNVILGTHYKPSSIRPIPEKHTDQHLLFTESISHEQFVSHNIPPNSSKPDVGPHAVESPQSAVRFIGHTSYNQDFIDLTKDGYRVGLARGSDDSNRVLGNSVPNRVKNFMQSNGVKSVNDIPYSSILDIIKGSRSH